MAQTEPVTTDTVPAIDPFEAAITGESTHVEPPITEADPGDENDAPAIAAKAEAEPAKTEPEKQAEKKPRHDPQARIDQAIARQREAERRAEDAERRARELETRVPQSAQPPTPAAPTAANEFPDFATWLQQDPTRQQAKDPLSAYMSAHYRWHRDQEMAEDAARRQETELETSFRTRAGKFSETFAKAVESDAAVSSRIDQALLAVRPLSALTPRDKETLRHLEPAERDRVAFRCFLADQWLESDHPIELLEHLSDPTVFQRLATLPPAQVVRALAKYEAGLDAASTKEVRGSAESTASHARRPIKPLATTSHVADPEDGSDDESLDAYIRRENAKDRKAGRL